MTAEAACHVMREQGDFQFYAAGNFVVFRSLARIHDATCLHAVHVCGNAYKENIPLFLFALLFSKLQQQRAQKNFMSLVVQHLRIEAPALYRNAVHEGLLWQVISIYWLAR